MKSIITVMPSIYTLDLILLTKNICCLVSREADRVILTACQQQGANQSTFQAVSEQLGNKTASEVPELFKY